MRLNAHSYSLLTYKNAPCAARTRGVFIRGEVTDITRQAEGDDNGHQPVCVSRNLAYSVDMGAKNVEGYIVALFSKLATRLIICLEAINRSLTEICCPLC